VKSYKHHNYLAFRSTNNIVANCTKYRNKIAQLNMMYTSKEKSQFYFQVLEIQSISLQRLTHSIMLIFVSNKLMLSNVIFVKYIPYFPPSSLSTFSIFPLPFSPTPTLYLWTFFFLLFCPMVHM
jgi:hypothetical protein